jgi:hypothetical protein
MVKQNSVMVIIEPTKKIPLQVQMNLLQVSNQPCHKMTLTLVPTQGNLFV